MSDLLRGFLTVLLYPLSILYGSIMMLRNFCYNSGIFRTQATRIFSVGIGNITVGGTGKTPHIEYFIKRYKNKKSATLSRGYGRKTKGFIAIHEKMNASLVGDEPWQLFLKFGTFVKINVGEKRAPAAEKIQDLYPEVDLLLLDDVFQHRAIQPDFMILLCDYNRPFFYDYPFPAGRLREFRTAAKRADAIIVSKCPDSMPSQQRALFIQQLNHYAPDVPVAFTQFVYGELVAVHPVQTVPSQWLLVTGIAQAQPLADHLKAQNSLLDHLEYADHHLLTKEESQEVVFAYYQLQETNKGILITEKDYARLSQATKALWKDIPVYYIPIEVQFLEGEDFLLQKIQYAMSSKVIV